MIKFRCSNCGHKLGVPETYIGRTVRCPHCQTVNRVEDPNASSSAADAPQEEVYEEEVYEEQPQEELDPLAALAAGASGEDAGGFSVDEPEPEPQPVPVPAPPQPQQAARPSAPAPAPVKQAPPPPAPPARRPRSASRGKSKYDLLTAGGIVMFVLAGLLVVAMVVTAVITLIAGASTDMPGGAGVIGGLVSAAMFLLIGVVYGFILTVLGVALFAIRDAARNSWEILARLG